MATFGVRSIPIHRLFTHHFVQYGDRVKVFWGTKWIDAVFLSYSKDDLVSFFPQIDNCKLLHAGLECSNQGDWVEGPY